MNEDDADHLMEFCEWILHSMMKENVFLEILNIRDVKESNITMALYWYTLPVGIKGNNMCMQFVGQSVLL